LRFLCLCCTTDPVRYIKFRNSMKGFSSRTLAVRLKQLERNGILQRKAYNEIPPRVEYRLTYKGRRTRDVDDMGLDRGAGSVRSDRDSYTIH
jgi:DNA-binding HxlR family transcriptional regulator